MKHEEPEVKACERCNQVKPDLKESNGEILCVECRSQDSSYDSYEEEMEKHFENRKKYGQSQSV